VTDALFAREFDPSIVDLDALAAWMDEHGLPKGALEHARPLVGGTQNVLLEISRGGTTYVLRRGPPHLRAKSNDLIRREIEILTALARTDVPHPRLIAACPDESVLGGAAFYLSEFVDGVNAAVDLPALHAHDAKVRHAMGIAAVDALARLGAVDHVQIGLGSFGHPDGFLERQVTRWTTQLESYREHAGYPAESLPGVGTAATWLERNRPQTFTPGVIHGDFHVANLLFSRTGPDVVAIMDWELATIGDPLLDLGLILATLPSEVGHHPISGALGRAGDLPTTSELVERYRERSSRDVNAVEWYIVMASFKTSIVLEGTYARACAGDASRESGDALHGVALGLLQHAQRVIREAV
jgi:aminoglycoside phosphotransferase (APT) family kinase protein